MRVDCGCLYQISNGQLKPTRLTASATCEQHAAVAHLITRPLHRDIRGIGFIEYADPRDAADAQRELDRMFLDGREVRARLSDISARGSGLHECSCDPLQHNPMVLC